MTTSSSINEYTAITKNALIENTKIDFDLYLRVESSSGHHKYILFCCADEEFSSDRREELISRNAQRLYISSKDTGKYLLYQEKNLKQIVEDSSKSSLQKSGALFQVARNMTQDILEDPKSGQNIERASAWVGNTVSHIMQDENTFSNMLELVSHDYQIYSHSINVSVIGLLFGKYLSFEPHELDCFGTGLLLHDIGKAMLPGEAINKCGKLTNKEFDIIKKHPKAGLELLEHWDKIDGLSLKVVIQHHENYDGTGYPYGIGGNDIHLFGHISRIVDAYDAMTSKRVYADAMRPFASLAKLSVENPNYFNKELLREFICFLGPRDPRKETRASDKLHTFSSVVK